CLSPATSMLRCATSDSRSVRSHWRDSARSTPLVKFGPHNTGRTNMSVITTTLRERRLVKVALVLFAVTVAIACWGVKGWAEGQGKSAHLTEAERLAQANAERMLVEGKQT